MDSKKQTNYPERNYGIDLLRIVAMMFIPILHVLGHGGILSNSTPLSSHYLIAWLLEILAYSAVNCYALISGFVGYSSKYRYSNIIYISFQVLFYTIIITGIFSIFKPETVGIKDILKAIFPFAFGVYWYYTAYFCMFFFIPFMNFFIDKASKGLARNLIITIIIIFSILPTIFCNDMFQTSSGYSAFWLSMMYLIGAYIKKYNINERISLKKSLGAYFICSILTWLSRWILDIVTIKVLGERHGGLLVSYVSPIILCASIMIFLFFQN